MIFWEGRAGVRWGVTLFHPHRRTHGMGTWRGNCPSPAPSLHLHLVWRRWTQMANTALAGAFCGKGLILGERRGNLGLHSQLPSRLLELSALQSSVVPAHPSSHGDIRIPLGLGEPRAGSCTPNPPHPGEPGDKEQEKQPRLPAPCPPRLTPTPRWWQGTRPRGK